MLLLSDRNNDDGCYEHGETEQKHANGPCAYALPLLEDDAPDV